MSSTHQEWSQEGSQISTSRASMGNSRPIHIGVAMNHTTVPISAASLTVSWLVMLAKYSRQGTIVAASATSDTIFVAICVLSFRSIRFVGLFNPWSQTRLKGQSG